jgi:SAM-dependent methyltransferase
MIDVKKSWDKLTKLYLQNYPIQYNTIHYGPLCPGENKLNLLGDISGLKAIDLGCGAGQNVVAMAKAGAIATGIDFSSKQIEQAKILAERESVDAEFFESDMRTLSRFKNQSFDMGITACAIAFVKELNEVLSEIFRILKPGGRFVLAVMHPTQYIIDGDEGSMYFNSTYPFKPRTLKWSWDIKESSIPFQHYLRSVSEYHNALADAGFRVSKILEPKPYMKSPHIGITEEIMKEYPYIAKHLPITLIMLAHKNPSQVIGEV